MGNVSNPAVWATMERLRFIERSAYWRGTITRQDLAEVFGLSAAQASADLKKYQEMNPGALVYNLNRRRYEGARKFKAIHHVPSLEEAMGLFLDAGSTVGRISKTAGVGKRGAKSVLDVVAMPERRSEPGVERRIFLAVLHGRRIEVNYFSLRSGAEKWRMLRPRAFAHDGNRWHVRAWCEVNADFRDFTLSRFSDAKWPIDGEPPPKRDVAWETFVTIRVRPHRGLTEGSRRAMELDYGMTNGVLKLSVRAAMADYLRARLRVPLTDGTTPQLQLEVVD